MTPVEKQKRSFQPKTFSVFLSGRTHKHRVLLSVPNKWQWQTNPTWTQIVAETECRKKAAAGT